jgi:hypothetical protein
MPLQHAFATHLIASEHCLWPNQLPVPTEVAKAFKSQNITRVKCKVKDIEWQGSILKQNDFYYIMLNQQRIKSFALVEGEPIEVLLTEDTSKYGIDLPESLEMELTNTPEALVFFEALTPGKIRSLIHIVAKIKSFEGQHKKARAIVHHLIEYEGKLDFKALNETIKLYNKGLL